MRELLVRLFAEEEGQDMIEYALLAAFISIIAWAIVQAIGGDVTTMYTNVHTATTAASGAGS